MKSQKVRPTNLDLTTIKQPVSAIASILHRVSGVINFILVGFLLILLDFSLQSSNNYQLIVSFLHNYLVIFIMWGFLTALTYHLFAGIRHMLMDLGCFEEIDSGRKSAVVVMFITVILSLIILGALI